MELRIVGVAGPTRIFHAQEKKGGGARPKFGESSITKVSCQSALRGSASSPSSHPDSLVANHRVTEVTRPLPLPV